MIVRVLAGLSAVPFLLGAAAAPADHEHVAFRFADARIDEASALVVLPGGLFATTNDSGDTGRVFVVDRTGATVGLTHWSDDPVDTEALAPDGNGAVWVGDIGDNRSDRESVQVARVPVGRGDRTVTPTVYDLTYPDGAHDAETLLCDPRTGRLYIASKEWLGGVLYAAPRHLSADHPNRLRSVAAVLPIATDGAFLPDGRHVIIRGYASASVYDLTYPDGAHDAETLLCDPRTGRLYIASKEWLGGVLYAAPRHLSADHPNRLRSVAAVLPIATDGAFLPDGRHVIIRGYASASVYDWPSMRRVTSFALPAQPQGEGIGIARDGTVYVSSEGVHSRVLRVPLPAQVRSLASPSSTSSATARPLSSLAPARPDGEADHTERSWWPWALGGVVGLGVIVVLLRSLRPR